MKFLAWLAVGTAIMAVPVQAEERPSAASVLGKGYLEQAELPDSVALLPAPPAKGSAEEKRDRAASKAGLALQGTARFTLATSDADLFTPKATGAFSCAAGFEISPQATPAIDRVLRRTMADFGFSSSAAKRKYKRERPFMGNGKPSCTPEQESYLRKDGSYPSGHSAIGNGWGLILASIIPERTTELVKRGRAFGDSRRVCNVHWLSDTEQGFTLAAATFARLQSSPAYQADLAQARAELATARALPPSRDCAAETAALALTP